MRASERRGSIVSEGVAQTPKPKGKEPLKLKGKEEKVKGKGKRGKKGKGKKEIWKRREKRVRGGLQSSKAGEDTNTTTPTSISS